MMLGALEVQGYRQSLADPALSAFLGAVPTIFAVLAGVTRISTCACG